MNKDKDNLAFQAFPWSLVGGTVLCWGFVFCVLFLYFLGLLRGFSLVLLPEGVSPVILLAMPVQGIVLGLLVMRIRWVIKKGKIPSYIQILIALILTVTTSFSVFVVLSYQKSLMNSNIPGMFYAPYDVSKSAGVDMESQKFPVEVPEEIDADKDDLKDIKRTPSSFQTMVNDFFMPIGEISHRILESKLLFLLFYGIPAVIVAGFANRYLLKQKYREAMKVSLFRISMIWLIAAIISIPLFLFIESFIAFALFPALGNFLTIIEIRKNISKQDNL
jgi:hypothetical protein